MLRKNPTLLNLRVHDERFSKEDLLLNPEYLPLIKSGDLLEIHHPDQSKKVIVQVRESSLDKDLVAKQPNLQISISQSIAHQFDLQARRDVVAKRIDEQSVSADFIELAFRDQYGIFEKLEY